MSKFKTFKAITAIAGLTVIGGGAAFAGMHWDGIKKVAQGPVYSEKELEEEVKTGTTQGTEKGYNDGYTKGFEDGVAYEPPAPEIKTFDVTDYKSIEGCPDIIKNCTYIKEYKLSDSKVFMSVNGTRYGNFIFDKTEKTFYALNGSFDGYKVFWNGANSGYFIAYGESCGTSIINANTHEKTQIETGQSCYFVHEISDSNIILATNTGIYHITLDGGVQYQRIEEFESGNKRLRFINENSIYYIQGLDLMKINLLQFTVTKLHAFSGSASYLNVLYKTDDYALWGGTDVTGLILQDLTTDELSVIDGTANTQNFKFVAALENKVFLGMSRNGYSFYILDLETKTMTTSTCSYDPSVMYEDDFVVIFGNSERMYFTIYNKSTGQIKSISSNYNFKSSFRLNNGYFISTSNEGQGYYIKTEDLTETAFKGGKFENCKKLADNIWQFSTEDETQVGIFNEETVALVTYKFV